MSDTKDASHTSKVKGQNFLFAFEFFFNSLPPEALFFLSLVSENIAASSASFLQAVLLWGASS
jgi:hypothetical protein